MWLADFVATAIGFVIVAVAIFHRKRKREI